MALTKVTLTGTIDTIKAAFTKVNDIIDDLLSTSNGLGASTIGIEDSAGNMAAANVETALAEIYTDTSSARTLAAGFDENSATTTGLTWGYKAGTIRVDNTITSVAASTIGLTDDATNYVELNQSGTMTKNTTAFTTGFIPIRQVVCASGSQSTSTDKRAWFIAIPDASAGQEGVVELATIAETRLGTDTKRVVTPSTARDFIWRMHVGKRAKFTWKDANEIYIDPSSYRSEGANNRMVYNIDRLTYTFTNLGVSDWSYLYIDDSDLESNSTNLLSADYLIDSTTEPVWSASKEGWYNGDDLCIFAVLTDGSSNILKFYHDGDFVLFDVPIQNYSSAGLPDTTWVDVTLSVPKFSTRANVEFTLSTGGDATTAIAYWRVNGGTGVHNIDQSDNDWSATRIKPNCMVITDSSQIIEIKYSVTGDHSLTVDTDGWFFPNEV
jgi:hypothetical protein